MGRYDSLFQRVASSQSTRKLSSQGFVLTIDGVVETRNFFVNGTIELDKRIQSFHLNKVNEFYRTGNELVASRTAGPSGYRPEARETGMYRFGKGTIFEGGFFNFRSSDGGEGIAGLRFVDEERADALTKVNGNPIWRAIEEGVPASSHRLPGPRKDGQAGLNKSYYWGGPGTVFTPGAPVALLPGGGTTGLFALADTISRVTSDLGSEYEEITVQSYS